MKLQDLYNFCYDLEFFHLLLELVEICDSFDQLKKLAIMSDLLYSPDDTQYKELAKALEKTARHLRGLPEIGLNEPPGYCCPGGDCGTHPCPSN